jgi:monoamine oxidase
MALRRYDDGSRAIPAGIDGPVGRVLVVGAGIAGLAAANALANAGREVVVLEGRDRLGGRLHTADVGGSPVDLGGAWIHTPIGNPLTAWADQLGVERRPGDFFAHAVPWDPVTGVIPPEDFARIDELAGPGFEAARERLLGDIGPDAAMSAVIDRYLADLRDPPRDDRARGWLRALLRVMVEQDAAAPVERVTLRHYPAATLEYGGDYLGDLVVGGYRRLTEPLAAGLDIRFATEVTAVETGARGVRVTTARGDTHEASHAVLTVPLGVLKAGSIRFEPPLSPGHLRAIGALGFGRMEKLAMRFARPFWTEAGFPHVFILPSDSRVTVPALLGLDEFLGEPVLVALGIGSSAALVGDGDEDEVLQHVLDDVEAVTGRRETPLAVARTGWQADRFSRGSYSYPGPEATRADVEALSRPHAGRVLFAGEATTTDRAGYADGAFSTGIREAKRLLGAASVALGPTLGSGRA